jgi:hypothetical protein
LPTAVVTRWVIVSSTAGSMVTPVDALPFADDDPDPWALLDDVPVRLADVPVPALDGCWAE